MSRLKIDLPADLPFRTDLVVRIGDINYGGHLGNDSLLSLLHEARVQFLASMGFRELDVGGAQIIMTDAVVLYRAEAFQGDLLRVEVGAADLQSHGCDLLYRVTAPAQSKEVARAKTGIAFFDYGSRTLRQTPEIFRERAVPVTGYRLRLP